MNQGGVGPFIDRLCGELPSMQAVRKLHKRNHDAVLPYVFFGDVSREALRWYETNSEQDREELSRLMAFLECEYVAEGAAVRQLIEQGFLENVAGPPEPHWRIRQKLGPVLRSRIEEMWPTTGFPPALGG